MSKFTFLEQEQYFDDKIDIIEKRGTKAAITDFSILLGGWVDRDDDYYHIDDDDSLAGRTGYYWTKSDDGDSDARAVDSYGDRYRNRVNTRVLVELAQLYRSHQSIKSPRTE